ncbi:hypothetical protein [Pseudarthrobacter sp. AB1]|uniref:hypothetical protein n=1 Tax=Pseudarthrobacter sp. AB1 TaxID=2138309 RepID=UPI00186B9E48|nr:hypothetical protein [Pseudarthrobacter sp. AB1]MBE4720121.1 hypothetical protein [Pseudarthrobacter sp. AB1]
MTLTELDPIEVIALDIARADMHYVATSLVGLPNSAIAAEIALLQYGAMAAYEAHLHFGKTLGWSLNAKWDADTAKAARMSGKFFADKKRNLHGVVAHFDELLRANRGAFFPPDRRGRLFDILRDDLSVVILDGRPYTSLVSAHYLTGLGPEQVSDLATGGPAIGRLSTGVGNVAGYLLKYSGISFHEHGSVPDFRWFDGKSVGALPRLFGGELEPSLAAALLTVHSVSSSAMMSSSRSLCTWCRAAARKHRFVALFQSLTALETIRADGGSPPQSAEMFDFLDDPESAWVLGQSKLRNGLIHLGLQDIAGSLGTGNTVDDAVRAYTDQDPESVAVRIVNHLSRFVDLLTRWMLSPTPHGKTFLAALHHAP